MGTDDIRRHAEAMLVFAEVVATGSFTETAKRLGLSKASVSREVARLERRLGAQLLRRTTRSQSLTEAGAVFYEGCKRMAEEAERAEQSVGELQAEPRGEVRFATATSFGQMQIAGRLPAFLARHPKLRVRMELTDQIVDLVAAKLDLAIRISGRLGDATLVQRRLCPIRFVFAAAPGYLRRHGVPRDAAALERHNCLGTAALPWRGMLTRARAEKLRGDLHCDNGEALRRFALADHGVVLLPTYLVGEDLRHGRLVRILPALVLEASAYAVYPQSRHASPKVRALIDYLIESLGPEPEWDAWVHAAPARRQAKTTSRPPSRRSR
jgi:DNA-binding transcriptional LysR family regulator